MSLWKKLVAGISSATAADVVLDSATHALCTIEYEHHEVHAGNMYHVHRSTLDLDVGLSMDWLITTPNTTKWAHMIFRVETNGAAYIQLVENPTVTATAPGGEIFQTPINRNRNSSNSGSIAVRWGASCTAVGGSEIEWVHMGTSGKAGKGSNAGFTRAEMEWVLKQNEDYLFRVASQEDDIVVSEHLIWYEHTDMD